MQVVRAVQRVEVQRTFALDESPIRLNRRQIGHHRVAVVAAQHIDVAGHVLQMTGVGHQTAEQVGGGQRVLRGFRHLHGVQVQMQGTGVLAAGRGGQRIVEDPLGLHDPRALCGFTGSGVPQRPCREVDQRVGGQRLHVDVVGVGLGQRRHRVGVGGVAGLQGVGVVRVVGGEAGLQRLDQAAFDRRGATLGGQAQFHPGAGQRGGQVDGVERLPGLVVVRVRSSRRHPSARSRGRDRVRARGRNSGSPLRG